MLPFNLPTYSNMLNRALDCGYRFIGFDRLHKTEADENTKLDNAQPSMQHSILLRHDVDGDLAAAATMAGLEAEMGISSTYFLMWRSPCYNLMSRAGQKFAESLIKNGHQIGLHYDQGYDALRNIPRYVTEAAIQREACWLEELLNTKVHAVSFHQPSSVLLQEGIDCGGRINTYDKNLLSCFKYISDSNRIFPLWLPDSFIPFCQNSEKDSLSYIDAIAKSWPQSMQLLIHPMWWVYDEKNTEAVWDLVLKSNFNTAQIQMLDTERAYGCERVFVIKRKSK